MGDLLGAAMIAGAGMFCALFRDIAVYVTALQTIASTRESLHLSSQLRTDQMPGPPTGGPGDM